MKKKIFTFLIALSLILPCIIIFGACKNKAKPVGIIVSLNNIQYEIIDNTITIPYGSKVNLTNEDFVIYLNMSKGKDKIINLNTETVKGYTFLSTIPLDEITPIGTYKITFSYENLQNVEITVNVIKANVDLSNITWNYSNALTYNKNPQTVELVNIPSYISVSYENNIKTTFGSYTATATLTLTDTEHYNTFGTTTLTLNWEIKKATITINKNVVKDLEYKDELIQEVYQHKEQNVLIQGLPQNVQSTVTGDISASEVGTYNVHVEFEYTGSDKDNYNPILPLDTTWKILHAEFTRIGTTPTLKETYNFTYDGTQKQVEVITTGLDLTNVEIRETTNLTATNAGTYTVQVLLNYVGDNPNYNRAKTTYLEWVIKKAPLTVKATNQAITYGEEPNHAGVIYSGFVNNEIEEVLGGNLSFAYTYTKGQNIGNYLITPQNLLSNNYQITYQSGTLTVNKKDITLAINNATTTYGQEPKNNGITANNLVCDDTVADLGSFEYSYNYEVGDSVGTYEISIININPTNYNVTSINKGTLTVVKADIDTSGVKLLADGLDPIINRPVFKNAVFELSVDPNTLPTGLTATVKERDNKIVKDAGLYNAHITFNANQSFSQNYNTPQPKDIEFVVARKIFQSAEEFNFTMGDGKLSDSEMFYIEYKQDQGAISPTETGLNLNFDNYAYIGQNMLMFNMKLTYVGDERITNLYLCEEYGGATDKTREEYEQLGIHGGIKYLGLYCLEISFINSNNVAIDADYYKLEFLFGYVNNDNGYITARHMELACDLSCSFEFREPEFGQEWTTYFYISSNTCDNNGSSCGSHGFFVDLTGRFVHTGIEDKHGNLTNNIPGYYNKCDCTCHHKYM